MTTSSSRIGAIAGVLSLVAFTAPAWGQEGDEADVGASSDSAAALFGSKGQIAISSDAGLSVSNTSVSGVDESTTSVTFRPAVDWFFMDDLSFGGFVGLDYTSNVGGNSSVFSVGPRLGYNVAVSDRLSIWPKLGLSLATTSLSSDGSENDETNTSAQLNLFAPAMFHPVPNFFIGLGPALDVDLSGDSQATTVAIRLALGGWV